MDEISETEREVARGFGLTEANIAVSWARYVAFVRKRYGLHVLLGGKHWARWAQEDSLLVVANQERDRAAKDLQQRKRNAYAKEAVTFDDWLALLRAQRARGEVLPAHEQRLVTYCDAHPDVRGTCAIWGAAQEGRTREPPPLPVTDDVLEERRQQALRDLADAEEEFGGL